MKKYLLLITVLTCLAGGQIKAQTFREWFFQNSTEKKYLRQQIIALQAYTAVIEKGYSIVKTGTAVIGQIKRGDLTLHSSYFNALLAVKPEVRAFTSRLDAAWAKDQIGTIATRAKVEAGRSGICGPAELAQINRYFISLQSNAEAQWMAFVQVNSNGGLQMTDAERVQRSESITRGLLEQYRAALTFSQAVHALCEGRLQELYDAASAKHFYNAK